MKVIWLCNVMIPQIAKEIGLTGSPFGGWLSGLYDDLKSNRDINLTILFPMTTSSNIVKGNVGKDSYFGFNRNKKIEEQFISLLTDINPSIIHIFGTEYDHSLHMVNACKKAGYIDRVVISIQGLVSVYYSHYTANLPMKIIHGWSLYDLYRGQNVYFGKRNYYKKGINERSCILQTKYIIGRTDWDRSTTFQINPQARYFVCNETLRNSFYENRWSLESSEKHSIFFSQINQPIKGFHMFLDVLPNIIRRYPDTHVYVTGLDLLSNSLKVKYKLTRYMLYLRKKIIEEKLENYITFLGILNESQMCERYLKSHVFISPSAIENSPNSVGEAMLLGVPTISSDVGGVKNMLTHQKDGYIYPFDEPYMIPYYISKIFDDDNLASFFSRNAREHALVTHNKQKNMKGLLHIYKDINNIVLSGE